MKNSNNTKETPPSSENASPSAPAQPLPFPSIAAANLPGFILGALARALPSAHFVAVAPNTTASLITRETISDFPPGYVVTLVFKPVKTQLLPPEHEEGKVYIVK